MSFPRSKGRGDKYAAQHQTARRAWKQRTTPSTPCVRCGHPLGPAQRVNTKGRKVGLWHLDHAEDGVTYLGFSHGEQCALCGLKCNVSAAGSKGARITNARRRFIPLRDWY